MNCLLRIAVAFAIAALSASAQAHDFASDGTQPEVKSPAPAIVLQGSGRAEAEGLNADTTQPHVDFAAPAVTLPRSSGAPTGATAGEEPWASMSQEPASERIASK